MFEGKGLLIDKHNNRYKKFVSVLFFKVGDWKPLINFRYVVLTKLQGSQTMHSARTMGNSSTFKVDLYCVYLCIDQKRKVLVCKSKTKLEAITLAKGAANYLGIPLNNYLKE